MSQQVTLDTQITNILKTWYTDEKFENLLFRNDPFVKSIKKNRIGGKTYNFGALYGRGGAVAGDYTVAVAAAASSSQNAEFAVPPGRIHSVFTLTQMEMLASQQAKGAYVPALINKMFSATEALRKTMAKAAYGMGFGEQGNAVVFTTTTGSDTVDFGKTSTVIGLDIGSVFRVTNGALPSSPLRTSVNTVTAIDGTTVTFTSTANETWAATDWVELQGSRDGSNNPNLPTGLGGWIPNLADRTGATWTTYIGTAFYGVTRSTATSRLAGGFYKRTGGDGYGDALLKGIQLARQQGGVPDTLVINDEDFLTVIGEFNTKTTYMQQINTTPSNKGDNIVQKGLKSMGFQFSTNYLSNVYDSPYCPKGKAWITDSEVVEFAGLSNSSTPLDDGIQGNNPGAPDVTSVSGPDTTFKLIIDDYINVQNAANTSEGPGAQVSLSVYGNFVVRNPAHCVAISF